MPCVAPSDLDLDRRAPCLALAAGPPARGRPRRTRKGPPTLAEVRPATPGRWPRRSTGSSPRSGPRPGSARPARPTTPSSSAGSSLDLVGKIPTAAEARDFLDDPDPDKRRAAGRAAARQPGLRGPGHRALAAAAAARGRHRRPGPARRARLRGLAPQARSPRRRATTGSSARSSPPGSAAADAEPARRDPRPSRRRSPSTSPRRASRRTSPPAPSRVFLGVRLECAQCHNHPFAKWKREQFWGLAAFFAGVQQAGHRRRLRRDPRGRRPPRAGDPRHRARSSRPRSSTAPSRPGRPRAEPARGPGRLDDRAREPVLRPGRGQPRLGPLLRHRPGRPGRRHGRRERRRAHPELLDELAAPVRRATTST